MADGPPRAAASGVGAKRIFSRFAAADGNISLEPRLRSLSRKRARLCDSDEVGADGDDGGAATGRIRRTRDAARRAAAAASAASLASAAVDDAIRMANAGRESRRLADELLWNSVHPEQPEPYQDIVPPIDGDVLARKAVENRACLDAAFLPEFAILLPSAHQARDFLPPDDWFGAATSAAEYFTALGREPQVTGDVDDGWHYHRDMGDGAADGMTAAHEPVFASFGARRAAVVLHERGWVVLSHALAEPSVALGIDDVIRHYLGKFPGEDGVAAGQNDVWASIHNRDNMHTDEGELNRGQGRLTLLPDHVKSSGSDAVEQSVYTRKLTADVVLAAFVHPVLSAAGVRKEDGRMCVRVPKTGSRLLLTTGKALPQKPHIDSALTAVPFVPAAVSGGAAVGEGRDNVGAGDAQSRRHASSAGEEDSSPSLLPPRSGVGLSPDGHQGSGADGTVLTQYGDRGPQSLLPPPPSPPPALLGPEGAAARGDAGAAGATPASAGSAPRAGRGPTAARSRPGNDGPAVYAVTPSVHFFTLATGADGCWLRVWPGSAQVMRHLQAGRTEHRVIFAELIFIPPYSVAILRGDVVHAGASAADNRERSGSGEASRAVFNYSHCVRLHMYVQDKSVPLDNAIHLALPSSVFRD